MIRIVLSCIAFVLLAAKTISAQEGKILKLPITIEQGYGPFKAGFGRVSLIDTNRSANALRAKGFPSHWKNFFYGKLQTDFYQWTYQNYKQGKLTEKDYQDLRKAWQWTPDEKKLTAKPIKCYVLCAWNIDENGHMGEVILDANNNLNFSDDTVFNPKLYTNFDYNAPATDIKYVTTEQYIKGKVIKVTTPLVLAIAPPHINYSIPQHGIATLKNAKATYKIVISGNRFGRNDFSETEIQLLTDENKKFSNDTLIQENEYITIGNKTYKHNGVDLQNSVLLLEEINVAGPVYSSQLGYYAFPFYDKEVANNAEISLEKYKGKYVFLDFWGTWCKPCIDEIPNLKKAYKELDSDKIAFIGIAYTGAEYLKEFIKENDMPWPQLAYTSEAEGVLKLYNIKGYPTTLLIDPQGKIIAKNIRGGNLAEQLQKLMK